MINVTFNVDKATVVNSPFPTALGGIPNSYICDMSHKQIGELEPHGVFGIYTEDYGTFLVGDILMLQLWKTYSETGNIATIDEIPFGDVIEHLYEDSTEVDFAVDEFLGLYYNVALPLDEQQIDTFNIVFMNEEGICHPVVVSYEKKTEYEN